MNEELWMKGEKMLGIIENYELRIMNEGRENVRNNWELWIQNYEWRERKC